MMFSITHIVGVLHLSGMVLGNVYGFLFQQHFFMDRLYLFQFVVIPLSWIVCKDECLISYIVKKYKNPSYELGREPNNVEDMSGLFSSEISWLLFYNINYALRIGSLWIVNQRTTQISSYVITPTLLLYSFYVYDILLGSQYRKRITPYFEIVFSLCLVCMIFFELLGCWVFIT
jgi:hypothetical protein